ncbi:hypothetical protein [Streptomyces mirabilis]|uniref:hypothetical protein n=1 Tax=Streptomyces mirabilis TaxID=68239 RepID=UPI0036D0DB50
MTDQPTAGNPPSVTAVIKFLKAAGFQHSRYTEAMRDDSGSGAKARSYSGGQVVVHWNEGDYDYRKRMGQLGITEPRDMPQHPDARTYAQEYAEALAPRYTVEISNGTDVYVTARETLPARPPGVPRAVSVRKALKAADVQHESVSAVDQPDHTRVAIRDEIALGPVRDALTAEGWIFEEFETLQHYGIKITGSTPDRPARLRKLRARREARAIELAGRAAVAKVEEGIRQTKAAEFLAAAAAEEVPQPQEPASAPEGLEVPLDQDKPVPYAYSPSGVRYEPGMRATLRTRDGFWAHGVVEAVYLAAHTRAPHMRFMADAYQVAPRRRAPKYMDNKPGKRGPAPAHTTPWEIPLDNKDLSPERFA